jgi:hypothetical protein
MKQHQAAQSPSQDHQVSYAVPCTPSTSSLLSTIFPINQNQLPRRLAPSDFVKQLLPRTYQRLPRKETVHFGPKTVKHAHKKVTTPAKKGPKGA